MRALSILILIAMVVVLTACGGQPAAEETPTQVQMETESVPPTPTPEPESSPTPEPTPIPEPTEPPVPTDTPEPPTPEPEPTQAPEPTAVEEPTVEPTPEPLAAPVLLEPVDGATFGSSYSDVTFRWTEAGRPLAENEYYVLIITHSAGQDFTWTKDISFFTGEAKQWLIEYGPELRWQVVIAAKRTDDPNENPTGAEISDYSLSQVFYWNM